jgi:hypothetical protein
MELNEPNIRSYIMTRKDYQLIASVLANFIGDTGDVIDRDGVAFALATALAEDNPRFDRNKFLIAAGVYQARREDLLKLLDN